MIKQISTEEMRKLLDQNPSMRPETRRLIETGQASFQDSDGTEYQAPRTANDEGPTHHALIPVEPTAIEGEVSWN